MGSLHPFRWHRTRASAEIILIARLTRDLCRACRASTAYRMRPWHPVRRHRAGASFDMIAAMLDRWLCKACSTSVARHVRPWHSIRRDRAWTCSETLATVFAGSFCYPDRSGLQTTLQRTHILLELAGIDGKITFERFRAPSLNLVGDVSRCRGLDAHPGWVLEHLHR